MNPRNFVRGVLVLVVLACVALPAMAQSVSAITGTITDPSGGVLPGVNVTLTNAQGATLGGNQQVITDEKGSYQFPRLVPGTYTVKAELQGFRPAEQRNISLSGDFTAKVDLKLEIGTLQEGVTVTGQAPLLDTTSALKQTVISHDVLEALPNRVDIWSITRVIPSVVMDKVDTGGSEAFVQSRATVHGTSGESGYSIDGIDVSSLDGNGTGATFYLDPFAYQETNFQFGGAGSAITSKGGLQYNAITRTGTNQIHGGAMFNGANHGMSSKNFSDALAAQVLAAIPAAAKAANPNLVPGADILKSYDTGMWASGPIVRDRLWFSGSYHWQALNQYPLGSYDPSGKQVLDDNKMQNTTEKVAWQMTKGAQLSWFNDLHYKWIGHRNGTGTNVTSFHDNNASVVNDKWPDVHQVKFTSPIGPRIVMDTSWGRYRADDRFGQEPGVKPGDISHFDSVTNTYTVAWQVYNDTQQFRDQAFASFSFFTGAHDVRFGYQFTKGGEKRSSWSPSGMIATYRSGIPDSVRTYNVAILSTSTKVPIQFEQWSYDQGLYFQDQWKPVKKLVINAGVRYEANSSWQPAACQISNIFYAGGQCYAKITAPSFRSVLPRFAAVYDLKGDGKTAIKFAANRYDQPNILGIVGRLNPLSTASDTRAWTVCAAGQTSGCDLNGDLLPQLNELGPSNGFSVGSNNRYAPGLKWPVSNEYSAEIQRQFAGGLVVSVGYTHRETRRNIAQRNVAVPTSTYIPLVVTETNSGRQVTVYNQSPALRGIIDNLFSNDAAADTNYNGTDISVNRRMSGRWSLIGGASFGHSTGDTIGGDLNSPNSQEFRQGIIGNDVPWSYRLSGVYDLPFQISASATTQYTKGFPEATTVSVGNNTVALTQGTQTVIVAPRGDTRLPNVFSVDMSLRRHFKFNGRSFDPRIDFYNLTNRATVLSRLTLLGSTYQRVSTIQHGRLIKVGFSTEF